MIRNFDIIVPRDASDKGLNKVQYWLFLNNVIIPRIQGRKITVKNVFENDICETSTGKSVYPVYVFDCYGDDENIKDLYPHVFDYRDGTGKIFRCA